MDKNNFYSGVFKRQKVTWINPAYTAATLRPGYVLHPLHYKRG